MKSSWNFVQTTTLKLYTSANNMDKTNTFIVLRDAEGIMRPMAFITPFNEVGEIRAESYKNKLEDGETLVVVNMDNFTLYDDK